MFNPERIENRNGDVISRQMKPVRLSRETVELEGVDIDVHFEVQGYYMPATETDPAEYPLCVVRKLEIGSVDVSRLLLDTKIADQCAELIEEGWKS